MLAVVGGGAQLVESGVVALADDAALLDGHGRFVHQGAVDAGFELWLRHDGCRQVAEACGGVRGQGVLQRGQARQRGAQRADVASVAAAGGEAGEQALEILDVGQDAAQGLEVVALLQQGLDGIVPRDDGQQVLKGAHEPVPQQAGAHGGAGGIEGFEHGGGGVGAERAARGDQVEVGERGFIEHHRVAGGAEADAADVGGVAAQIAGDVVEQGAGGAGGGGMAFAAEAVERLHAEVAAQAVLGGGRIEDPILARRQGDTRPWPGGRRGSAHRRGAPRAG